MASASMIVPGTAGRILSPGSPGAMFATEVALFDELGLPSTILSVPVELWESSPTAKLHSNRSCRAIRHRRAELVSVDLTATPQSRLSCTACSPVGGLIGGRALANGVVVSTVRSLLQAWKLPAAAARRVDNLTAAAASLAELAGSGDADPRAVVAARELIAAVNAELGRSRAARTAQVTAFAQSAEGRFSFALMTVGGVGGALAGIFHRHGLGPDVPGASRALVSDFGWAINQPGYTSGDPAGLRERLGTAIERRLPAFESDDVGGLSTTGPLGERFVELLVGLLAGGDHTVVADAALAARATATAEAAGRVADEVFAACQALESRLDESGPLAVVHVTGDAERDEAAYAEMLCARFDHHVALDGSVTALVPTHLAPVDVVAGDVVFVVADVAGFDPARLGEYAALCEQLSGPFPSRLAAALALVD